MKVFYPSLLLLALAGCRSFPLASLNPTPQAISPRLPALEKEYARSGAFGPVPPPFDPYGPPPGYPIDFVPPEIRTLFEREIDDRITQPLGRRYGFAALRVNFVRTRINWFWPILSTCTLFIGNAFGMPYSRWRSDLDLEVHILNANHELVGRYRGVGRSRAWTAPYWGYDSNDANRVAYTEAFREAMAQIKVQLNRDAGRLRLELLGVGSVP